MPLYKETELKQSKYFGGQKYRTKRRNTKVKSRQAQKRKFRKKIKCTLVCIKKEIKKDSLSQVLK